MKQTRYLRLAGPVPDQESSDCLGGNISYSSKEINKFLLDLVSKVGGDEEVNVLAEN
jgi:hypothetical protein